MGFNSVFKGLILKQTTEAVSWIFTICSGERTSICQVTVQETACSTTTFRSDTGIQDEYSLHGLKMATTAVST